MQTATTLEDLDGLIKDTGIERIDREHLRLVEYLLEMGDVVRHGKAGVFDSARLETQTRLFKRFLAALKTHFKTEEHYINRYNLKGKSLQQREHEKVLSDFSTILEDFQNGILSTFQTVRINLISGLINHINGIDHQTFLLENFLPVLRAARQWDDVAEIIKATGLPAVDAEHRELTVQIIDLKNYLLEINNAVSNQADKATLLQKLASLHSYTRSHFIHEENFLDKYDLDKRRQSEPHQTFLGYVDDLTEKITKNTPVDLSDFMEFLFSWWINHINGIDFVEFHFSRIAGPVFARSGTKEDFTWLIKKTGIESVDNEHANLIGLLLKLSNLDPGHGELDVKRELEKIAEFASGHFSHEEALMKEWGLKGRDIHEEAHVKLLKYVGEAMKHAVSGRSRISPSLLKRIMRWWIDHTNGMDYDTFVLNRTLT